MGDILATYAVIGFALLPFLRRDDRTVLRWAAGMLFLPIILYALMVVVAWAASLPPPDPKSGGAPPQFLMDAAQGFSTGDYVDIVKGNVIFTGAQVVRRFMLMFFPRVFGMFLLGFYIGRRNLFADLDAHLPLLRRMFVWVSPPGFPWRTSEPGWRATTWAFQASPACSRRPSSRSVCQFSRWATPPASRCCFTRSAACDTPSRPPGRWR
jgi:uncharacterized membrane protein YeiB